MFTLYGADIYLRTPKTPDLPGEVGTLRLVFIANRGTRVFPPPAPEAEPTDWPQCRYLSDVPVTDEQVDALAAHLTALGWQWTKLQKLFKNDGVDAFSKPY